MRENYKIPVYGGDLNSFVSEKLNAKESIVKFANSNVGQLKSQIEHYFSLREEENVVDKSSLIEEYKYSQK